MAASDSVGLVLARPARMLGIEPFSMELIAGIEETLAAVGRSLLLHVVPDVEAEIRAYYRWAEGGLVEAVILINLALADRRLPVLQQLGLPTVIVGGPDRQAAVPNVWIDNAQAMREAVEYLVSLGHTRLARVAGPSSLAHTLARTEAFREQVKLLEVEGVVVEGDYSEESGAQLTRVLLTGPVSPTAIIYDNDIMAVAGLGATQQLGIPVPDHVSLLAWDDSALCRLANPPVSAMSLDVHCMGTRVARCVLDLLSGHPKTSYDAPTPRLIGRGTTAPPAAA